MRPHLYTAGLRLCSNVFMTVAWYARLKNMAARPGLIARPASRGIVLFETLFQVPANRIGHQVVNVRQLKILQEIVTLAVFVPFSLVCLRGWLTLDYRWAGLGMIGAVFFVSRGRWGPQRRRYRS